jgi:nicotinamide-nucleotide adenylyltransferase
MTSLGCVTGRFQPVHDQHLELFEIVLAQCDHLVVAMTNPDVGARRFEAASAHRHTPWANPFNYFERACLLEAALRERGLAERATIVPFDLTQPAHWPEYVPLSARQFVRIYGAWEREKVRLLQSEGYPVVVLEGDPSRRISASVIRAALQADDDGWHALVPPATLPLLAALLAARPMRERG